MAGCDFLDRMGTRPQSCCRAVPVPKLIHLAGHHWLTVISPGSEHAPPPKVRSNCESAIRSGAEDLAGRGKRVARCSRVSVRGVGKESSDSVSADHYKLGKSGGDLIRYTPRILSRTFNFCAFAHSLCPSQETTWRAQYARRCQSYTWTLLTSRMDVGRTMRCSS